MTVSERLTYEEFGTAFVAHAVTPQRILAVVRAIAGDEVNVGPIQAGPGGMAQANAHGRIGEPNIEHTGDDPLSYLIRLPVELELRVDVGGGKHDYTVQAEVRITLTVHLERPLVVVIEPATPGRGDVDVKVRAKGMQAKMVGKLGDIDNELKHHIAAYVRARIEADTTDVTRVDLEPLMAAAWPD